ncbi:VOC family protein [Qipengyuania sp. MTN3-11]|uniref:VOC family protein n=1 Tax=Qipengyuania sp. MTN3-11 TaxID=3056557 RepID=UPI0036F2A7B6
MPNHHGDFIWYELMTSDADAAQEFYAGLIGWTFHSAGQSDMDYRLFRADGPDVGGLMQLTSAMQDNGARPLWTGYIGVDDVDQAAVAVKDAKGSVMMEPQDIPDVGRFAFCADPYGAPFYIMRGFSDEHSTSFAQDGPVAGHCAWNELASGDREGARKFYEALFGWELGDSMDMGEMGPYDMYRNPPHTNMLGAILQKSAEMPVSLWNYYFRVPDIDAAAAYTTANGGQILFGPAEIPGGEYVLNGMDPQGAMFALLGKRN